MNDDILAYRYEPTQSLGSDGIFETFRAQDRQRGRTVKVRVLSLPFGSDPAFMGELKEVAKVHMQFSHPGLERIYDIAPHNDTWVIASEYEDGSVLEDRLKRLTSFSVPNGLSLSIAVAEAVAACHAEGLVHGDLSTRTIYSKSTDGVKLMAAGFWRAYSQNARAARIVLPRMAPYLAPEITMNDMPSNRSDIYSLGVLLFRLFTGKLPFLGETPAELTRQHIHSHPPSMRRTKSGIPMALDQLVAQCMEKEPSRRPQSAEHVLSDLRRIQDELRFGRAMRAGAATSEVEPLRAKVRDDPARESRSVSTPAEPARPDKKGRPAEPKNEEDVKGPTDGVPLWLTLLGGTGLLGLVGVFCFWLFVNLRTAPSVTVPDVVGENIEVATRKLADVGLTVKVIETASDQPLGRVLDLTPRPGQSVKPSFPIQAEVSAGSATVDVPDLRGRTLDEARQLLGTLGLRLSDQIQWGYDARLERRQIIEQVPLPRRKLQRMSFVRVKVNTGVPTSTPDEGIVERVWRRYRLEIPLPDPGTADDLNVEVSLQDGDGRFDVYSGRHRPGETIAVTIPAQGNDVVFTIRVNGLDYDAVRYRGGQETAQ
ncbi:MAG: protein kinase [Fimbriimonadaceae bacterium]|nr:protein kinase [Fimbriimonadaceae bacterium]